MNKTARLPTLRSIRWKKRGQSNQPVQVQLLVEMVGEMVGEMVEEAVEEAVEEVVEEVVEKVVEEVVKKVVEEVVEEVLEEVVEELVEERVEGLDDDLLIQLHHLVEEVSITVVQSDQKEDWSPLGLQGHRQIWSPLGLQGHRQMLIPMGLLESQRPLQRLRTTGSQQDQNQQAGATGNTPPPIDHSGQPPDGDATGADTEVPGKDFIYTGDTPRSNPSSPDFSSPANGESEVPATPEDWCEKLDRLMNELKEQPNNDGAPPPENGPERGELVWEDTIWRAIAGVTEAISTSDTAEPTQFTLTNPSDSSTLHQMYLAGLNIQVQQAARPGNEAFFVRTEAGRDGHAHNSLYHLRRVDGTNFELVSYDSAQNNGSNPHRPNRQRIADNIRLHYLETLGWQRLDPSLQVAQPLVVGDPPARQNNARECGIYVIIYAWALALGLDISNLSGIDAQRQHRFQTMAVDLITLSLQGHASSELIEAFLKCFDIVDQGAVISGGRRFDRTVAFQTEDDLSQHISRLRLQKDLEAHGLPPMDVIRATVEAMTPDFFIENEIWVHGVEALQEAYDISRTIAASLPGATEAVETANSPEAGAENTTEQPANNRSSSKKRSRQSYSESPSERANPSKKPKIDWIKTKPETEQPANYASSSRTRSRKDPSVSPSERAKRGRPPKKRGR
jgi:hypothetical protein